MPKKQYKRKPRRYQRKQQGNFAGRLMHLGMKYATPGGVAFKALKLARRVADAVNTEYKYIDSTLSANAFDNAGTMSIQNAIAQGLSDSQRVGDSAKIQNVSWRYYVQNVTGKTMARVMLLWDPQNRVTAVNQILETTGSVLAPISPKLYDTRFQTKVLYDRIHNLYDDKPQDYVDIQIPINLHTQFLAASTTITTGALRLVLISNQLIAAAPTLNSYMRVTFTDN